MTPEEKLRVFRDKIFNTVVFDSNFRQLIGIELFDFIQKDKTLKTEFYKRFNYLKNLAADRDFKILQDNLFETIQKILKFTSLQEVEEQQKEWNNRMINKLKTRAIEANGEKKYFLTLPELYLVLQDKNNYYRLGDSSYFSPMEGEISTITHIVPVRKQYEVNVEGFFKRIFPNKFVDDKKGRSRLDKLMNQYNEYWYKLDEAINRIPAQLHTKSFERFFLDCMSFHPRQGWESYYDLFSQASEQNSIANRQLKEAREVSLIVIDDLIETLKIEEGDKKEDKNCLKSILLLVNHLGQEDVIFMVLDRYFNIPIRFAGKNKNGQPTSIKKLYDIAYFCDAPNKKVSYNKSLADNINNGLFRREQVAKYMKTNKFEKPTLVQKSEDGTILVLRSEVEIKICIVKNDVPFQYRYLYIDKTK